MGPAFGWSSADPSRGSGRPASQAAAAARAAERGGDAAVGHVLGRVARDGSPSHAQPGGVPRSDGVIRAGASGGRAAGGVRGGGGGPESLLRWDEEDKEDGVLVVTGNFAVSEKKPGQRVRVLGFELQGSPESLCLAVRCPPHSTPGSSAIRRAQYDAHPTAHLAAPPFDALLSVHELHTS
jgi:hypothetical protein